jgi:hypothetical protein
MDCIENGFEIHDPGMIYIATKMLNLDPLFKNPRFFAICEVLNEGSVYLDFIKREASQIAK